MFKKFRNAISEVTEEVKANPRFQNLNQLASQTYSSMSTEGASETMPSGLSSEAFLREDSTSEFFSLGHETALGESSLLNEDLSSLFPAYEAPPVSSLPQLEMESATEAESSLASEASVISKEQLLAMLSRSRTRAAKYKTRYAALAKAYQDVQSENAKISNVMQQTQDKALRRISELREQCSLSQKAKQHLEEELRGDMEEKEHIIKTLETKVALLKSGGEILNHSGAGGGGEDDNGGPLVVIDMDEKPTPATQEKMVHLEEKVKRLENLLNKCKESITANKQKIAALVEVKESLSKQLSDKSIELTNSNKRFEEELGVLKKERDEALQACKDLQTKDQNDELQIAESKLMVHQRELRILEDEMKAKLIEKENENRLALEENDLRIKSLVKAEESKNELLRDLEMRLKSLGKEKMSKDKEIEGLSEEMKALREAKEKAVSSLSDQEEALKLEIKELRSLVDTQKIKLEEFNNMKLDLLSQIETKEAMIRGLEEAQISQDSLERRYYNESLPDMIQSKDDEIKAVKEESKLEISVLKEELEALKSENAELRSKSLGDSPLAMDLEDKKQEILKLEAELGNLLTAKQELEGAFNMYRGEQEKAKAEIKKQAQSESLEAISKKDELIKVISLESSNEMEKLKKELNEVKTNSETNLENLKSINESKITKIENKNAENIAMIEEKHQKEMEEMTLKISELRQGKNIELLEENTKLQKSLSALEEKFKVLSDEYSDTILQKTQVQKNLEEKLHEIDRMNESQKHSKDLENSLNDCEKEIASLRERERSQKDLEAQMIRYQKELQSEIKRMEDLDKEKSNLIHELRIESESKSLENQKNAERFDRQVSDLKQDLEMKIRLERDRENAHTELKRQSIEYQKKLQEQLQEKESFLAAARDEISCFESKIGNINNLHAREIERLSNRISELTTTVKELEERRDCDVDLTEKTLKECDGLRENLQAKEEEIRRLQEAETSLNAELQDKSCDDCSSLRSDINSLKEELDSLKKDRDSLDEQVRERGLSQDSLEKEIAQKNEEIGTLLESKLELQENLKSQSASLSEKEDFLKNLTEDVQRLKTVVESVQREKEELVRVSANLKANSQTNEELESKMKDENNHRISELEAQHQEEIAQIWRQHEERLSEAEELFESQKKDYVSSIEELSSKVLKLQEEIASHSWGSWDNEPIDLQNHIQTFNQNEESASLLETQHSIATLKISNNNHRTNSSYACSLEEAAEFEYLKNILYQYMLGKESLTLAKVLATVVKFNQEQVNKIMLHEEQKKSVLSSFGLHNS